MSTAQTPEEIDRGIRTIDYRRSVMTAFQRSNERGAVPLRDVRREYATFLRWAASIEAASVPLILANTKLLTAVSDPQLVAAAALLLLAGVAACGYTMWRGVQLMEAEVGLWVRTMGSIDAALVNEPAKPEEIAAVLKDMNRTFKGDHPEIRELAQQVDKRGSQFGTGFRLALLTFFLSILGVAVLGVAASAAL